VTWQALCWILLFAGLAVCVGLLLGTTWTLQIMQSRLRRQAEERRKLDEEWTAVRTARQRPGRCPYCTMPLPEYESYPEEAAGEDPPDDD
jgi:hypothetical protein